MAVRAVMVVVAVLVVAWLSVMEYDTRRLASGVAAAGRAKSPASVARADADLRAARLLNPDTAPDLARALLYDASGRSGAPTILEDVLRREPDNLTAWALRYSVARAHHDRAAMRRALAARRRLDPINAR